MSKDLIDDRYGRFYEISLFLSKNGHCINIVCHSYKNNKQDTLTVNANMAIESWNLGFNPIYGFVRHYCRLDKIISSFRPNLIIGASDCFQIIMGSELANRHSVAFVADLYDNLLSYDAAKVPGVKSLFYRALKNSDAISIVSNQLLRLINSKVNNSVKKYLLENAVARKFIIKHNKLKSRGHFGFKQDKIYIGTAGALRKDNGVELLLKAAKELIADNPNIILVLAGPKEKQLYIPESENILYLGHISHDEIPLLFSALDVGIICVEKTEFGNYCFPQKFYEMVSCGLPLIASDVGEMSLLLEDASNLLYQSDNKEDMKRAIQYQISHSLVLSNDVPTWETQAIKLDIILNEVLTEFDGDLR